MRHAPCQTTNHQGGLCFEKSSERREGKCFFQIYLGKKFPPKLSQQVFVSEKAYAPDSKSATPLAGQPFPNIIVSRICPVYQSPYPSGLCLGLSWRNPHLAPRRRWCSLLIKPTSFIDDYGVVSYWPIESLLYVCARKFFIGRHAPEGRSCVRGGHKMA